MNIIGIHAGHNSTVSLILNNRLVAALSEEKFNNVKNSNAFPVQSLRFILDNYELTPDDIDIVSFSSLYKYAETKVDTKVQRPVSSRTKRVPLHYRIASLLGKHLRFTAGLFSTGLRFYWESFKKSKEQKAIINFMDKEFGFKKSQVMFTHHHLSHAYAPIGFYNLHRKNEPILIFTQDGFGDLLAGTIGIYENGRYKLLGTTSFLDSVAWMYAAITQYFGMKELEHEYKVMGLAAYPSPRYALKVYNKKLRDLVQVKDGKIILKYKTLHSWAFAEDVLKERLFGERFDNIAFSFQKMVEDKITKFVEENMKKYKIYNLAFGGGLFMNVKLNKRIQELPGVKNCYFMPSAGDESLAIGSAFFALEKNGQFGTSDEIVYLGKSYSDEEIEYFFSEHGLEKRYNLDKVKDPEKEVAAMVNEGKIVGRFSGRGEWGARSLGNRAILADPSKLESVEVINNSIKARDFWMPFACSILDSRFEDYAFFNHKSPPYYMITTFDTKEEGRKDLKAGLHRKDHTMRPNVVIMKHNPEYWKLLKHYEKLSGIGGILNTSLNIHGYPLVGFIGELFFTLDNSHLNYSQCGNFIVSKKSQ